MLREKRKTPFAVKVTATTFAAIKRECERRGISQADWVTLAAERARKPRRARPTT